MTAKKIILLLSCIVLIFAFVACKTDGDPNATKKPNETAAPTETPVPTPTPEPTPSPTPKPTREPHSDENPYYGSIKSENPFNAPLFKNASPPNSVHLPEELTAATTIAWQFVATMDFDYVDIAMCTWSQPNGAANFSIYRWNYDYEQTIAGEPVYSKTITSIQDNTVVKFELDQPLGPGEYVVYIQDNQETKIGIWKVPYTDDDEYDFCRYYVNDMDVPGFLPQGTVHYLKTPQITLLKISDMY